jgi:hypothetical protein
MRARGHFLNKSNHSRRLPVWKSPGGERI